jgi:endogenous inhibitor of DNA gyrase (YacG/DUF329 family)
MIQGRCPICSQPYEFASIDDLASFPFCSDRCRLIDLGRWIDGTYVIPGAEAPAAPGSEGAEDEDSAEELMRE